ncbi:hypothetical protein HanLR1_Chr06g0220341 [Helianthus annuus]|nr:hypothetical protein HanHA89_Chr06g0236411 [Helianthus annuus]KAJ0738620.1 hypothetical protein HanLR1_Chr06g0220341 [Helianthus annuus]
MEWKKKNLPDTRSIAMVALNGLDSAQTRQPTCETNWRDRFEPVVAAANSSGVLKVMTEEADF